VAVEKPLRAMEAHVAAVEELKPVKQADSECLRIWYEEFRAIRQRAKMEGVYSHLLTEAVVNKILNVLPPKEKELMRARMAKPMTSSPADTQQLPERLWEYVWRWQRPQPLAVRPAAVKAEPPAVKGAKRCLVEDCKGASTSWLSPRSS
jgi:hypothetical protein